nr:hypothetical protein [Tanacetum cinerariifolium]
MPHGFGSRVTWGGRVRAMVLFRWVKVYGRCCGGEGKKGGKRGCGLKYKDMEEQSFVAIIHHKTNLELLQFCLFSCFLSQEEPKKNFDALKDQSWVEAMQEELLQFKIQNVWILVDCPKGEERIDYEEVFAPVARIKAIRIFLAYASFIGFIVYQMDVKSAFLYGTIDEEVYVMQPPRFQDLEFPDRVYKVEKAIYGLHQAPRAWYGTLFKYLLDNGFQRGTIDQTLFIRKHKREFLLVQVYVDDIIFGLSNLQLCRQFKELMHEKFQMSAMGELTFFLGLQVLQKKDDIFLSPNKYVGDILKKFGYSDVRSANTPMDKENPWGKDGPGKDVELHLYRSMIGSLMYLTASRPDIMFAVWSTKSHHDPSSLSHPTTSTELIPQTHTETPTATPTLRRYSRRAIWIAQSKALSPAVDEPVSLLRDERQGEAFPIVSSLDARQDRENINKTFALPRESSPRVTSLNADEGSMQHKLQELMDLCTSLQRQQTQMAAKIKDQDLKISGLKERVKFLKDKDRGEKSTKLGRNNTEEMVNVLSSMEAANILTSGVLAASISPVAGVPTQMRSLIIGAKDKGKQKVVESDLPKKRKIQEQIDAQVAREMVEELAREDKNLSEQLARDLEIARIHAEEELKVMIERLDRSNEVIAKHLQEYEQAEAELTVGERIELINKLVKYQYYHAKILKYQAQQNKPLSKKEQREFYMSVLRSHAGYKTKHFRGIRLEEIKEKFISIWKQLEDFVPMSLKKEGERVKRKGLKLDQGSAKRIKTFKDVSEEDLKGMMQLVPLEDSLRRTERVLEDYKTRESYSSLPVELKRLFELKFKDQLWTHNQAFMYDPLEWKLYDTCGVHHVFTKDQEMFMLVEKDYPLRKGLATVMICNKLQVEQYSHMANDLILKIHNIANSPR